MEWFTECPVCYQKNIYQSECDNMDCLYCGSLFIFCPDCGWTDHEICEVKKA